MRIVTLLVLILGSSIAHAAAPDPVEFSYLGLDNPADPDGTRLRFKVSAPSVRQVDVELKFIDAGGKQVAVETYAWQNIVKSKQLPIEAGKTYETDRGPYEAGAARVEARLVRVIFADGTRWNAR